jgi:pimeloyl-ACP methyl ester carboxylesterase
MTTRIFIHGLESSNQGTKSVFFRERYPDMVIPHFTGPLTERMDALNRVLSGRTGIRIVGSSFGGLMGAIYAMENEIRMDRLVLLAPAVNYLESSGYAIRPVEIPVTLYHGIHDEVIPLKEVRNVAERLFPNLDFHAVGDDHVLHKTFRTIDWDTLLNGPNNAID